MTVYQPERYWLKDCYRGQARSHRVLCWLALIALTQTNVSAGQPRWSSKNAFLPSTRSDALGMFTA